MYYVICYACFFQSRIVQLECNSLHRFCFVRGGVLSGSNGVTMLMIQMHHKEGKSHQVTSFASYTQVSIQQ